MQNNNYRVEYLSLARSDVNEAVEYILNTLQTPLAAERFVKNLDEKVLMLEKNPYIGATYKGNHRLSFEYRHVFVGNFTIFYVVFEEKQKKVEIHRIIYSARNMDELI